MKEFLFVLFAVSVLFGCKKEETSTELKVNQDQVSLHYDEQFNFSLQLGGSNVPWKDITATVQDRAIGTINNSGAFSATRIGTTTVTFQYGGSTVQSTVTVEPYETFFTEPVIIWEAYRQDIQAAEKRNELETTPTRLVYQGENNNIRHLIYLFESNRMSRAGVFFADRPELKERVLTFYRERYDFSNRDGDISFFTNADIVIGVGEYEDLDLGLSALYFP